MSIGIGIDIINIFFTVMNEIIIRRFIINQINKVFSLPKGT
jgi:hypothetical protein